MLTAAEVAAVGAVDVDVLKIFNRPCKKLKNLNFSGHFKGLFIGIFCWQILICSLTLHILSN